MLILQKSSKLFHGNMKILPKESSYQLSSFAFRETSPGLRSSNVNFVQKTTFKYYTIQRKSATENSTCRRNELSIQTQILKKTPSDADTAGPNSEQSETNDTATAEIQSYYILQLAMKDVNAYRDKAFLEDLQLGIKLNNTSLSVIIVILTNVYFRQAEAINGNINCILLQRSNPRL